MTEFPADCFACPRCRTRLVRLAPELMACPQDGLQFRRSGGIWRLLLAEREPVFARFRCEYETIRKAEGRGDPGPAYYQALPYRDLSGRMSGDWQIRSASFLALIGKVVAPLEQQAGRALRILDLGSGNGWLSNRLARSGHDMAAVDLADNNFDGLGCYRFYDQAFTPVQAEFDRLPFVDGSADLAIFNASLHYSLDYSVTLGEAQRVLCPQGLLVVVDSPVYADPSSGDMMVAERQAEFQLKYGFPSNALPSENFLTYSRLGELAAGLGLDFRLIDPSFNLAWRLRPHKARLLGRREPAKFHVIVFSNRR